MDDDADAVRRLVTVCDERLSLCDVRLGDEYFYNSLPLCVIDAVYSIGAHYSGVRNVVARYCAHAGIPVYRLDAVPAPSSEQQPVSELIAEMVQMGVERFRDEVFCNRQRTSIRNGISKAEAVYHFARALSSHGIEYLQDMAAAERLDEAERAVRGIPGQRSGISWQYFLMLTGRDDLIKPDRMILRFLEDALKRNVSVGEALGLLQAATAELQSAYPHITPILLDHAIWGYQRQQPPPKRLGPRPDVPPRMAL